MELYYADIKVAVYDDYRDIIVLPTGLSLQVEAHTILELMRERR